MRASFSSFSGSGDSFQVLVRWDVIPSAARIWRSRSRPLRTLRPFFVAKNSASLRIDQWVNGRPSLVGRVLAVVTMTSRSFVVIWRGRPPAH